MDQLDDKIFCNDGSGPLRVPGFADIDHRYRLPFESRFATPFDGLRIPNITARELAVLRAINVITDKNDWATVVSQDDSRQLTSWYIEAQASSDLINENSWDWIVRELRDKVSAFLKSGSVLVFNTGAIGINRDPEYTSQFSGFTVYKSDSLVPLSLIAKLEQGTSSFSESTVKSGLNYPVDPSMYPLVFNRTPVLTEAGEIVTLDGRFGAGGARRSIVPARFVEPNGRSVNLYRHHNYSDIFQWLPCEVEFRDYGEVAITSYINNLHPFRFHNLYRTIEKMISISIEPWNQIVVKNGRGRTPLRILTFGVEYSPPRLFRNLPWVLNRDLLDDERIRASAVDYIEKYYELPGHLHLAKDEDEDEDEDKYHSNWKSHWIVRCNESSYASKLWSRWARARTCPDKHPQMGQALTYDAWKAGDFGTCVVPPMRCENALDTSDPDYDFQAPPPVFLQETFQRQGLQVIVKLASIELNPTQPRYAGSDWAIEGMRDEHIVAVAVCYYSVENIEDAQIAFLHTGRWDPDDYDYFYYDFETLAEVIAIDTDEDDGSDMFLNGQKLGTITARQGRFLAYPNHLMSRVNAFELQDKTRPGHLRSLVLCLVDPHYRICSTRNVPPQQPEFWFEEALQAIVPKNCLLPVEIENLIWEYTKLWPMSLEEAIELSQQKREPSKLRTSELWGPCSC